MTAVFYSGSGEKLEHDFRVKAGSNEMLVRAPSIYQNDGDRRIERQVEFVLLSNNEVGFTVAGFDPQLPLVIDPVLDHSTFPRRLVSVCARSRNG
jgi:hypothetical protein